MWGAPAILEAAEPMEPDSQTVPTGSSFGGIGSF